MTHYFRITAYHPTEDLSVIMDTNGMFEKLWQFSSFMVQKGFKILEVGTDEKFLDVNIEKAEPEPDKLILRATDKGKPIYLDCELNGVTIRAVQVKDKIYVPEKEVGR